jgi:hypothetical protein
MGIFIIYIIYLQNMFLVLNYINIWFELIIQKIIEMKILKMAHLVIFHLKMTICQIFNLPCIYGQCPKRMWYDNYQTLHMVDKPQYLIKIKNFIKIKKHFNHFWVKAHYNGLSWK